MKKENDDIEDTVRKFIQYGKKILEHPEFFKTNVQIERLSLLLKYLDNNNGTRSIR